MSPQEDQCKLDGPMWGWVDDLLDKVANLARDNDWSDERVAEMLDNWELGEAWRDYVIEGGEE